MQGSQHIHYHASLKSESVWFKTKLISQFLTLSFLLTQPFYLSYLHAAPVGGNVVGGSGSINQSNLTTTINQTSQNLAINWDSFDIKANERVNFVQPNTSSIALNRILGNNGTTIQGQINANGQVILVNPNGIYFTSTSRINVGGLIASSLDMTPSDFMNGNYIFNEVLGTDGAVINSGIINASLGGDSSAGEEPSSGGNVALIGKKVKNEGVISAILGSVVLAAGKQSVLTFDNQGLIGVRITKHVLQEELGLDEAIINSGDINAAGGRILLTASTSQDVFSQAVNSGALNQATSVVVNDDGSFTLGGGADVLNTGSIDVSSEFYSQNTTSKNTARIIILGENVTSSGSIKADTQNGDAGEIEIHSKNKTTLIENSIISAQALATGRGGLIKILGDKVGLFDFAQINASGANGGGEVLIGGDRQGLNTSVRNADFIFLGADTEVKADATKSGDGGKIITFAKDTARIYGNLFARGGLVSGNGGFIETSGLRGFDITNAPDTSAFNGNGGLWLIDPFNIKIVGTGTTVDVFEDDVSNAPDTDFYSTANTAELNVLLIQNALLGGDVDIITSSGGVATDGNITFDATLDFDHGTSQSDRTLTLKAHNDIIFTENATIFDSDRSTGSSRKKLDIKLEADSDEDVNGGDILFSSTLFDLLLPSQPFGINTHGGKFEIKNAINFKSYIDPSLVTHSGVINTAGGKFVVKQATDFDSSNMDINVAGGDFDLDSEDDQGVNGNVVLGTVTANNLLITKAKNISQSTGSTITIASSTELDVSSVAGTQLITLTNTTNDFDTVKLKGKIVKIKDTNSIDVVDSTITDTLEITAGAGGTGNITNSGAVTVLNGGAGKAHFDAAGTVTFTGSDDDFDQVNIVNATVVNIIDSANGIAFAANNGAAAGEGGVTGNLTLRAIGGDITSYGEVNAGSTALNLHSFTVDDAYSIYLTNSNNTFTGDVFFLADSGNINNITITDDASFTLQNISLLGNLDITADTLVFNRVRVNTNGIATPTDTGIFNATTTGIIGTGDITRNSSDIIVYGVTPTTFDAAGSITLTEATNDFQDVTITNGNIVSLRDTNAMSLLSSTTTGNLSIQAGGDISLVGDITTNTGTTAAGNVLFTGNVLLATPTDGDTITINTNHATLADGTVTFNDFIDNDQRTAVPDPRNNLEIISGDGDVDFKKGIGVDYANIGSLIINKGLSTTAIVDVKAINTRTYTADSANSIDITAGTINLNGNLVTNNSSSGHARGINLNGNVVLNGSDIVFLTSDSDSAGAVTVTGTINSDAGNNRRLEIESGSAEVALQGVVGGSSKLKSLNINAGKSTFGTVKLAAVNTTGGDGGNNVIDIKGTTIELNGDLTSNDGGSGGGGNIKLEGNLLLNQSVAITSDSSSNSGSNGDVIIIGDIDSTALATTRVLTINADNNNISVSGNIGTATNGALQKVDLITDGSVGTQIDVNAIRTTDADAIDNTPTVMNTGVKLTAATINLDGNITSNTISGAGTQAGEVDINGAVNLTGNVSINTNLAGSTTEDGNVDFSSTVESTTPRSLTIDAGNANVNVVGDIGGNSNELSGFTVTNAGQTDVRNITTRSGGVDITSGTVNLYGGLNTTANSSQAGSIVLDGSINLLAVGDIELNTDVSGTDALINLNGAVNNTSSKNLTLDAGLADVSMTGTAGAGVALQSLTVTGNNVELGQVNSTDAIDVTGNTNGNGTIDLSGDLVTSTALGTIDLLGADVSLLSDVNITTLNKKTTISGDINSDSTTQFRSLTVNVGSGDIEVGGNIGTATNGALQKVELTTDGSLGTQINVNAIRTTDADAIDNTPKDMNTGVKLTAETINLGGDITSNTISGTGTQAGEVYVDGDVNLTGNVSINTNLAGSTIDDGNVDFRGTIDSTANLSLTIDAGSADVNVEKNIGAANELSGFTVTNAGITDVRDITTRSGGVDITSGTVNLYGGLNTTANSSQAGSIVLDGSINLLALGDIELNTDVSGTDALINLNGAVNNATSKNLTLDAGTADVSMTGTAGTGTALQSLIVKGNNVALGQVTSVDAIDVTANTTGNGVIDLSGNLTTTGTGTSSSINLKQADVTLGNNVTLQVANTTANNITVEGMIDSDLSTNNRSLTIIAGSGVVDLQGDIGSVSAIQGLTVTAATSSTTNLQAVTTRSGGINVTTSSLNLAGDLVTNDNSIAGDISLTTEKVDLTNNMTLDTVSTSTDGNIDILTTGAALGLDGGTNAFTVNAGLGDVMISHNISNVSGFDLQSSGTTILNGISSLGMITTNANNGLTLNGSYSAMTLSNEVMSFNADSNGDGAGILRFGAGSSFINTSGPITFTGATFNSGNNFIVRTGVNGTDTVRFNATNHMSLGDNTVGFRLNNVQLSNVTASDIRLNAVNDIYYSNISQLNGPAYVLNAGNDIRNTGFITSTFSSLNATAVNTIDVGGSITTNQDLLLTGTTINISGSQTLRSNNGNVILNGVITGATGDLSLYADNAVNDGLVQFVTTASNTNLNSLYVSADSIDLGAGNITTNNDLDINIHASTGAYSINSNMESLFGSVNINAGSNAIVMASGTMIKARNNVDLITSSGGIGLSLVESTLGQINITAGNAPIYDNNNGATNITSSGSVILTAVGGIGSGDALELRMNGPDAELSAFNSGSGSIEVSNTGDITLLDINNAASNSPFKFEGNGGDVTIGSITLDTDIANTNAEVSFNMLAGSVYGVKGEDLHVTSNSATFNLNGNGEIGDEIGNSPLIVDIRYKLTDINTTNTYIQYYLNRKPQIYEGANQFKNKALQAIENISGQQLIEVEALGNVDEAIFSDVRNYNHSDIALMMPSDQRYTEDEEEDEDAKLKRQKLINSTP